MAKKEKEKPLYIYAVVWQHRDYVSKDMILIKVDEFRCTDIKEAYNAGIRHIKQFTEKQDDPEIINIFKTNIKIK